MGVAFDAQTDTLLLFVRPPTGDYCQLVSLRSNASEWLEVQRFSTRIRCTSSSIVFSGEILKYIVVCDSRVLLVERGGNTMYVFDVSAEHTLRDAGNVTLQSGAYGVACTCSDGVTLVAYTDYYTSVSLLRLSLLPLRLVPLASISLPYSRRLLFREDLLLVTGDWEGAIVAFRTSDNLLTERRVLLDAQAGVRVFAWALTGDRLVLFNWNSGDLLVYDFT